MRVIEEEENAFLRTLENGLKRVHSLIHRLFVNHLNNIDLPFLDTEGNKIKASDKDINNLKRDIADQYSWDLSKDLNIDFINTPPSKFNDEQEIDYQFALKSFKENANVIDGKTAFELYDTFGFPLDLTALIARDKGLTIDEAGFNAEMEQQKNRSRNASASEQGDWMVLDADAETEFTGYDHVTGEARLIKYRKVTTKNKTEYHLVLDRTPFYAESGGQVGDTGFLESGLSKVKVHDTRKENDLIIHVTHELPEDVNAPLYVKIDASRRKMTQKNHSATHLLHAALRNHLGDHVHQKGSLVNDKLLRFDFSHFTKVTDEQIHEIERMVNSKIRANIQLNEQRNVPIAEAKEHGAMALFGEKYGEYVRVITFDKDYSVELCGGTHVASTGEIGFFKIVSESSVAAGVRRIEAVTANAAEEFVHEQTKQLEEVKQLLGNPQTLAKSLEKVLEENSALKKQLEQFEMKQVTDLKNTLANEVQQLNGINFIARQVSLSSADYVKKLAFDLRQSVDNLFLVLAAEIDGKPQLTVMLSDNLVSEKGLNATQIVKELAKEIQGGGGGQPFYATAGGKNAAGLANVPAKAEAFVKGIA
ncbi:hypothetical protein F0P94_18460 [Adhaeribacter soli]|uniref:Alanine--tRNA ligase n=2 Tax=Adhaeribacter soli TaxID=2607655 RepID=A0A5N1IKS2_9BACT|nr:hypothetical protein F0P94_18460 [Adhaeribacter soli]